MKIVRVRVRISGRVQGVFFRRSAKEEAERLGLSGFARNEPDGSVTVEAEGPEESVATMLRWAERGPSSASVEDLTKEEIAPLGTGPFGITG